MSIKILEDMQTLVSLSKRRGFVFQSSEIYGGLNSCWDYGPLGALLKWNVKRAWWKAMTRRSDVVGLDAAILMHPRVWEASGHVDSFSDPLVDCRDCKNRFRQDKAIVDNVVVCPKCESKNITEPRDFNLMFETQMGAVKEESTRVYLRPETAQGIFVNFENVQTSMRKKIPFGIAQIGKSFRNEITPGNFIFRTREFEQMEMQFFVKPGTDDEWFQTWKDIRWSFYKSIGLSEDKLRYKAHGPGELAFYAKEATDVEFKYPMGWEELEGVHNRTDYDLTQHQEFSRKKLQYFDEQAGEKYIPYVIETAVGCDRLCLAIMCDAYREETIEKEGGKTDTRVVMAFPAKLAPYKAAILPLSKKPDLQKVARAIAEDLRAEWDIEYDEAQSIGKRYRRQDEIGTPYCITVDFDTLDDKAVTIRHRDTMEQERVSIDQLKGVLAQKLMNF